MWGRKAIEAELRSQIESLKAEKVDLLKRIDKLQEAIVAVQSPVAYQEMKYDERAVADVNLRTPEEVQKTKLIQRLTQEWMHSQENQILGPDDLEDLQRRLLGTPTPTSLHGNQES